MAQAIARDEDRFVYAGTGTYGDAAPRYAPERTVSPQYEPEILPRPRTRTRSGAAEREKLSAQVSYVSIIGFIVIAALAIVFVYNLVMLLEEKSDVYAMGTGGASIGLRTQLDNLKKEEEKLIADFERTFGYEYVSQKAVEMFDMVPGIPSKSNKQLADKAEIPSEAYAIKPVDLLDQILDFLG